jgi:hypothetical protein
MSQPSDKERLCLDFKVRAAVTRAAVTALMVLIPVAYGTGCGEQKAGRLCKHEKTSNDDEKRSEKAHTSSACLSYRDRLFSELWQEFEVAS